MWFDNSSNPLDLFAANGKRLQATVMNIGFGGVFTLWTALYPLQAILGHKVVLHNVLDVIHQPEPGNSVLPPSEPSGALPPIDSSLARERSNCTPPRILGSGAIVYCPRAFLTWAVPLRSTMPSRGFPELPTTALSSPLAISLPSRPTKS